MARRIHLRLWQIDPRLDKERILYLSYADTIKIAGKIDPKIYRCVFDGELWCDGLEEIYDKYNQDRPDGYTARSLSVSDVVEIYKTSLPGLQGFWFYDSVGFKKLEGWK